MDEGRRVGIGLVMFLREGVYSSLLLLCASGMHLRLTGYQLSRIQDA